MTEPETHPEPQAADPKTDQPIQKPKVRLWLGMFLSIAFGLGLVMFFLGRPILDTTKGALAMWYVSKAETHIDEKDWSRAAKQVALANRWAPDSPNVIRLLVRFIRETNGDRRTSLLLLEKLVDFGEADLDDLLAMCQTHLDLGDVAAARKVWKGIPEDEKSNRLVREQYARILREEGATAEAEEELRQALLSNPDDPECQLRLAVMDVESRFGEVREQAVERLWELAKRGDQIGLNAIAFMAKAGDLNVIEIRELMEILEGYEEQSEPVRFAVLSERVRLDPLSREDVIAEEIERYRGENPVKAVPLLRWLSSEKEFENILKTLPRKSALRAPEVFPFYAQALGELGRWVDLEKVLNGGDSLPISAARRHLMLAETYSHLEKDLSLTRQQLDTAYETSGRGKEVETTVLGAQLSERLGLWTHAARFYRALSGVNDKAQIPMLNKVFEMAERDRNGDLMLEVTDELAQLRPSSAVFRGRALYLRLVMGLEIETSVLRLQEHSDERQVSDQVQPAILQALASFRLGDLDGMRKALAKVESPTRLPPGQRAAYVGMLAASGDLGAAFHIAEGVPQTILLDEERRILRRAL